MGCSTSKSVEVYSRKVARPEPQQHALDSNAHLVALTSSTYGFLRLDTQKKANDNSDEPADDPVNLMYQKMMSLDAPGQSWSEVSTALSQLKSEAQNKATVTRPAKRTEPETVDVSELLEHAEEPPPPKVVEQPRAVRKQASQKRDISVIHTLEEVDKLAIVPVLSPDVSESDDDDFQLPYVTRSGQRFSTSTSVRSRPKGGGGRDLKSSKSLTVVESQNSGSTLFDAEFLESFKEAFEQLSTGVPSTTTAAAAAAQTKSTAKGNKIAQLGAGKTTPFKPSSGVNVDENKASSPKPVSQRKLKVADQPSTTKVVNDLPTVKSKQKNLKQQEPPPEFSNKSAKQQESPANKLNQQRGAEESNDSPKTRKPKLQQAEPKNKLNNAQETTTTNTKLKEASEMSKTSRQKEIPVFSSKKTTVKPSEPALLLQLPRKCPPDGDNKVVLYSTSLRGIRKTFEDCNTVRSIVQSFNVEVDERDVSMDSKYRQELRDLMDKPVAVPRLFIKGRYVGGAEEVVGVHESGGLEKMLHGFPRGNLSKDCDGCGGMRFIPCTDCNGSCKAVSEDGKVIKCPDCNENGLVRCPICS